MELDNFTYKKITLLTDEGNVLVEKGQLDKALKRFEDALKLIPEPKEEWEASIWLYTAIGDVYFLKNNFKMSLNFFLMSLKCSGGIDNPFIQLRIGQSFFELGNNEKAKEYLLKAYILGGDEIFENESLKYYNIIN